GEGEKKGASPPPLVGGGRGEGCLAPENQMTTTLSLRRRLRERGLDGVTLLVIPGVVFVLALFIYPFLYGLFLSFTPKDGGPLANYEKFFSDPFLYDTV